MGQGMFHGREHWWPPAQRWRLVLAATLAGAVAGLGLSFLVTPSYQAVAAIQVLSSDPTQLPTLAESKQVAATVLTSEPLLAKVAANVGLDKAPLSLRAEGLRALLSVEEVAADASVLRVRVRLPDGALAARAANAIVTEGASQIDEHWRRRKRSSLQVLEARAEEAKRQLD